MEKKLNLLLFSGDYDKALAGLIIANGARALGHEVSVFFAFWGLLIIQNPEKAGPKKKTLFEQAFGLMTPKTPEDLPISKMNMAGIGQKMLKAMMKDCDAPTLSDYLSKVRNGGVRLYACQLSVEVMGFSKEELLPEVEIMDVQSYLKTAMEADMQLFI